MRATEGIDLVLWQLRADLAQRDATIAQRDATLAQREATIAVLQAGLEKREATIAGLQTELEERTAQLAAARARIAELQAQLLRHFKVSPDPPSGAPLLPSKAKHRTRRKRGGQPGHPGHCRALVPSERVSQVVALVPTHCSRCGQGLSGTDSAPAVHQVVEVPPLSPEVTEYRMHQLRCADCGAWTREPLPVGVPAWVFGPRLGSMVAILTGKYHLSKRMVEELLADFLGVPLSLGSVCKVEQTVSAALEAPVQQALESVPQAPVVHQDETSWWQHNGKAWLWVAVTALVTVFQIALSRGNTVCKQMLGKKFSGTLVSDRYSSYLWVPDEQRQFCWSHYLDTGFIQSPATFSTSQPR